MRTKEHARGLASVLALFVLSLGRAASAEFTGYELAASGPTTAVAGETLRIAATAYEVDGLATLRTLPQASIHAELYRLDQSRKQVVVAGELLADRDGHFVVELAVPIAATPGALTLAISVGRRGEDRPRVFESSLSVAPPFRFDLISDRQRYEPGETIHAFALLRRRSSGMPVADARTTLNITGPDGSNVSSTTAATRASGAIFADVALATSARDGNYTIVVRHEVSGHVIVASRTVQVGQRTVERMLLDATVDHPVVSPGGTISGTARVRAASGAPIAGATVTVASRSANRTFQTDAEGVVHFEVDAPAFLSGDVENQTIDIRAEHPAYGMRRTSIPIVIARSPYRIEIVADGHSLVPEVLSRLYVHVVDPLGRPAPAGTEVEVTGAAVEAHRQLGRTDRDGFVEVAMRVPIGATSRIEEAGPCNGNIGITFDVRLNGATPMSTSGCATVADEAMVAVRAKSPVVAPGTTVELEIQRRPAVASAPVLVDAIVEGRVVASVFVPGNQGIGRIALPADLAGFVELRARPLGRHDVVPAPTTIGAVAYGVGSSSSILVRPADAFTLGLDAGTEVYPVRGRATVRIHVSNAQTHGFYSMVARDLAQHGGETDYALAWLVRFFEAAVISPAESGHDGLVRAALASAIAEDSRSLGVAPIVTRPWDDHDYGGEGANRSRGELFDPLRERDELVRRRIGQVMMQIEAAIAGEMGLEDPESRVYTQRGGGFLPNLIAKMIDNGAISAEDAATLGGRPMTIAMLSAADAGFRFENVAARLCRARLAKLMMALLAFTNPDDVSAARVIEGVPPSRWLSRLVEIGMIEPSDLIDPWGRSFVFRPAAGGTPRVVLSDRAPTYELVSPGRDGRAGSGDDVKDPFIRVLAEGTPYAVASGEDELMKAIASIAPADQTLQAMLAAYETMSLAALDEQREGPVTATASEEYGDMPSAAMDMDGLGMMGAGVGSGYGMGYGSASGRASSAPRVMAAQASISEGEMSPPAPPDDRSGQGGSTLARVGELVRERFPATLLFVGEGRLEGTDSSLEIPLADALTTYRVEAIGWNTNGWITTATTEFRVDQQATVDAAIPEFATVGDQLRVPVRIENRGTTALRVKVGIASEGIAIEGGDVRTVEVAPRSSVEEIMPLLVTAIGEGHVVVRLVRADDDAALDAVRRPIHAYADARLVRESRRVFVDGTSTIAIDVPADASERGPGNLRLATGFELFGRLPSESPGDRLDRAWAQLLAGLEVSADDRTMAVEAVDAVVRRDFAEPRIAAIARIAFQDPTRFARALALAWGSPSMSAELSRQALERLGADLPETNDRGDAAEMQFFVDATRLLALAPIARDAGTTELGELVNRLRSLVENGAARSTDMPVAAVMQAAALAATNRTGHDARAAEVLRRLDRLIIRSGDGMFLEGTDVGRPHARELPTALLAIAYASSGDRRLAFDALHGILGRPERSIAANARIYAAAAAGILLGRADASNVSVRLDDTVVALADDGAVRAASLEGLGRPGRHRLLVTLPANGAAYVELDVRYGRPWTGAESRRLPIAIDVDGAVGARDTRAGLSVRIRNEGPRLIRAPIVEIDLPGGAELDEPSRRALAALTRVEPTIEGRTLRLALRPLAPGAKISMPLGLRWTVGGTIRGLGVTVFDDSPTLGESTARAVLVSRSVELPDHGVEPAAPEPEEETEAPPPPPPIPLPILRTLAPTEVTR